MREDLKDLMRSIQFVSNSKASQCRQHKQRISPSYNVNTEEYEHLLKHRARHVECDEPLCRLFANGRVCNQTRLACNELCDLRFVKEIDDDLHIGDLGQRQKRNVEILQRADIKVLQPSDPQPCATRDVQSPESQWRKRIDSRELWQTRERKVSELKKLGDVLDACAAELRASAQIDLRQTTANVCDGLDVSVQSECENDCENECENECENRREHERG
jgi:hypothetical protein